MCNNKKTLARASFSRYGLFFFFFITIEKCGIPAIYVGTIVYHLVIITHSFVNF